jgi:hypothetical protein
MRTEIKVRAEPSVEFARTKFRRICMKLYNHNVENASGAHGASRTVIPTDTPQDWHIQSIYQLHRTMSVRMFYISLSWNVLLTPPAANGNVLSYRSRRIINNISYLFLSWDENLMEYKRLQNYTT